MTGGMRLRSALLAFLVAYVVLDLCSPLVPGAFSFDPGASVDAVRPCRVRPAALAESVTVASEVIGRPSVAAAPARVPGAPAACTFVVAWRPHATLAPSPRRASDDD